MGGIAIRSLGILGGVATDIVAFTLCKWFGASDIMATFVALSVSINVAAVAIVVRLGFSAQERR